VPLADAGAVTLWQEQETIDSKLIDAVHRANAHLVAWTVDDPVRMQALASLGVDAICTNRPDVAKEHLG
jgi:glycerophosphoryl diester phosphodiesterase